MKARRRGTHSSLLLLLSFAFASCCAMGACGSRTGLLVPVEQDASSDTREAPDAPENDAADAGPDATPDVADAFEEPETFVPPDAPDICPDAGSTLIYVITLQNQLLSFYPPTASFETIGTVLCPDQGTPFSMAVDRKGTAYILFSTGNLYRVSTKTALCGTTPFVPGNDGFPTNFGMGFSANTGTDGGETGDGGETLYVTGDLGGLGMGPAQLGWIDLSTFQTQRVGQISPIIEGVELTGTGSGELFGFYFATGTQGAGAIGQIDKSTALLLSTTQLSAIDVANGWAFAYWGGDFYTFTAPDGMDTEVQRYRPSDGSVVPVATLSGLEVVGAGVSTCAPQM